jgi:EAL domain-containing protein (putative c-di-GMP-specific phosphodiesterase class I)
VFRWWPKLWLTADQQVILCGLRCDVLQGDLLGQPLDSPMSERLFARPERRLLQLGIDAF